MLSLTSTYTGSQAGFLWSYKNAFGFKTSGQAD
jgi:hypothetical protein